MQIRSLQKRLRLKYSGHFDSSSCLNSFLFAYLYYYLHLSICVCVGGGGGGGGGGEIAVSFQDTCDNSETNKVTVIKAGMNR